MFEKFRDLPETMEDKEIYASINEIFDTLNRDSKISVEDVVDALAELIEKQGGNYTPMNEAMAAKIIEWAKKSWNMSDSIKNGIVSLMANMGTSSSKRFLEAMAPTVQGNTKDYLIKAISDMDCS